MRYPKRESVAIVAIILAAMAGDAARAADVRIPQAQYNANPPFYYEPEVLVPYERPLLYGYPPPPPPVYYRIGPAPVVCSRAFLSSTLLRPMVPSPALWGIRWAYRERAARLRPPISRRFGLIRAGSTFNVRPVVSILSGGASGHLSPLNSTVSAPFHPPV